MDSAARGLLPRHSTVRVIDGLVVFWVLLWVVVGGWAGATFWQLAGLGDTISNSGQALGTAGEALANVAEVPVVGDSVADLAAEVTATSAEVIASGQSFKSDLRLLSLLLGFAIAVMPTTPVLGFYLPLRWERHRDRASLRRALAEDVEPLGLDRFLAERAVSHLHYGESSAVSRDPYQDALSGSRALADLELARLGLRRPRGG
jgi:hypothetical protein